MDTQLDPLRNSELHRALAFARARETYPGLGAELLLELCNAAWERSAGDTRDGAALARFERALDVVARSYRVGGGRLSVSEVAQDAIPLTALQPYIDAQKRRPAAVEPAPEPVAATPPRRTLADKLARVPKLAPAPLGVSLAAGVFGVAAAAQAGALDQTPLAPLSFTDRGDSPAPAGPGGAASADHLGTSAATGGRSDHGAGSMPGSPWVGELAGGRVAQVSSGNAAAPPKAPADEVTGAGSEPSPVAAPLEPASGGTPAVPTAPSPAPPTPAVPSPRVPAASPPAVHVELGGQDDPGADHGQEPPKADGPPAESVPGGAGELPVGVHYPAPGSDGDGQGPVISLPGGVQIPVTPVPAGDTPPAPSDLESGQDANPATGAPAPGNAEPAPVQPEPAAEAPQQQPPAAPAPPAPAAPEPAATPEPPQPAAAPAPAATPEPAAVPAPTAPVAPAAAPAPPAVPDTPAAPQPDPSAPAA